MDPQANLDEQLRLAVRIQGAIDGGRPPVADDVDRLAELVLALHGWMLCGGFLPGYVRIAAVHEALQAGHENDSASDQVEFVSDLVGFEAKGARA